MSKVVTFFNPNNNYSITRNININDADLTMPDNIFDKILFLSDTKIIITDSYNIIGIGNIKNKNINITSFIPRLNQNIIITKNKIDSKLHPDDPKLKILKEIFHN